MSKRVTGFSMRKLLVTAAVLAPLVTACQQGGDPGSNPGVEIAASGAQGPQISSMPGGFLGKNAGADLKPFKPAHPSTFTTSPTAWCDYSRVSGRCRSRAEADHAWCMAHDPQHYAACRQTMDHIGWHL